MSISVSKVVNVSILTSPTFPARKGFGLLCIIGNSASLPVAERMRFYSDMTGVATDFPSSSEEYKAAQVFFSQSPRATELAIARRFSAAVAGELMGSLDYNKDLAQYNAITTGALSLTIDGVAKNATGINLGAAANFNAVATAITTALNTASPGSSCIYTGSRFIIRSGTTGAASTVGFSTTPSSGTDLGPLLGLRASDGAISTAGSALETVTDTLNKLQDYNQSWYGFTFTKEVDEAGLKLAAAWAEAQIKIFGYTTSASNVLDAVSSADIASFCKASGFSRTIGQYDNNDDYAIVSAFARAFTVNFAMQNSTLTLKFKQEPGVTPVTITETQRQTLNKKCINYYTYFGDSAMLAEGVMASGRFFDEIHGLDWLQNAIETNVFGYLYTSTTKVPQTDKGVARLVQQVAKALDEAVNNGLLAPGNWNGSDLGEVSSGDFLAKGYYIYAQPVALQNQSDREARKAPPIQVIAKGAGAIHSVDIAVTFER